jgi:hypothetical protein
VVAVAGGDDREEINGREIRVLLSRSEGPQNGNVFPD